MSARNPVGDFSGITKNGEFKTRAELLLANVLEGPGGAPEDALAIGGGVITPTHALVAVDTGGGAAEDLNRMVITNHPEGRIVFLRSTSSARVVTLKHAAGGGDGQFDLFDDVDLVLDDPDEYVAFILVGVIWRELFRCYTNRFFKVEDHTEGVGAPYALKASESNRKVFTNRGAAAKVYLTLPAAAAGMRFKGHVVDADGLRFTAQAGDTIRWKGNVSIAGGIIETTTIGDVIDLYSLDGTEWVDENHGGTKTVT